MQRRSGLYTYQHMIPVEIVIGLALKCVATCVEQYIHELTIDDMRE